MLQHQDRAENDDVFEHLLHSVIGRDLWLQSCLDDVVEDARFKFGVAPAEKNTQSDQLVDVYLHLSKRHFCFFTGLELAHLVKKEVICDQSCQC